MWTDGDLKLISASWFWDFSGPTTFCEGRKWVQQSEQCQYIHLAKPQRRDLQFASHSHAIIIPAGFGPTEPIRTSLIDTSVV